LRSFFLPDLVKIELQIIRTCELGAERESGNEGSKHVAFEQGKSSLGGLEISASPDRDRFEACGLGISSLRIGESLQVGQNSPQPDLFSCL
jgi:hypothetical protein